MTIAGVAPTIDFTRPHAVDRTAVGVADAVAPRVQPALEQRRLWERRYARRLRWTDTAVVVAVTGSAAAVSSWITGTTLPGPTLVAPIVAAVLWLVMLAAFHSRSSAVFGAGVTEYKRVAHATGLSFGLLAIAAVMTTAPSVRPQLLAAPAGLALMLTGRWAWRRWLTVRRREGAYASRTIVIGSRRDVEYVLRQLTGRGGLGHRVVAVAVHDCDGHGMTVDGVTYPVAGPLYAVSERARDLRADSIIVAGQPEDDPDFIQRLSWELEGTAAELILSSRLTDVAGPRVSLRPIDGLPLIHVSIPQFEGGRHTLKRAMDIIVAALALIPIGIVAPFIALAIRLDSRGPVIFRQTRIGRDGREFAILKFRTMRASAEAELAALSAQNEGAGPLFKLKRDPRVTRVGAVLRKFSLDELPQFWNVLRGDMSVVGPRPPLPSEVTAYDGTVFRRLYIKPGITGLWQVSGRSDLSWDESIRLDLRYVENWSVMSDLMIMWRTAKVMVSPSGAY